MSNPNLEQSKVGLFRASTNSLNPDSASASGSATGNPRNKTALKPGHSLMDWIRLGHSGQDLTGVGGLTRHVTPEELAQHNTEEDCWLALRGTVYNVTHYMDFHPGGAWQLMKGAGIDATEMFDEVHAYVNYSSILQKCVVGRLKQSTASRVNTISELSLKDSDTVIDYKLSSNASNTSFKVPTTPDRQASSSTTTAALLPLDWYQKDDSINIVFYTKIPNPGVKVTLTRREVSVHMTLRSRVILSTFTLANKVNWPCRIEISDIGKVDIEFVKVEKGQWTTYGTPCVGSVVSSIAVEERRVLRVVEMIPVTYNTKLIVLRYDRQHYNWVPIGHHLLVHYSDEGRLREKCRCPETPPEILEEHVRMYTPVPPHLHPDYRLSSWHADCVCLMIKEYATGAVTPWICNLKPGDTVTTSGPEGHFRTQMVKDCTHLYMIAAGTGITPMLGLTLWALEGKKKKSSSAKLMFFNRTSEDILWREQMDRLATTDNRFSVTHVLSQPDAEWDGAKGHVSAEYLQSFLPDPTAETTEETHNFITVCGPTLFTQVTRELLGTLGYQSSHFHCFVG